MLKLNIQFFGGRGSSGSRNSGNGGSLMSEELSDAWSEDPEIYQALADPARAESYREMLLDDGWEPEEIDELQERALTIRNLAETQTVDTDTLYRGERFRTIEEAKAKYKVGAEISTRQITSYSDDKDLATYYATFQGTAAVIITNKSTVGKHIGARMNHTIERGGIDREILVPKGMKSKVTSTTYDRKNNILYVTMTNSTTPRKKK